MTICLGLLLIPALPASAQVPVEGTMVTSGDLNGDGVFDNLDLIELDRVVTTHVKLPADKVATCDVDGDGKLTGYDLLVMSQAYKLGLKSGNMFDAIKSTIEQDLGKEGDNVEIYLDLARFYAKENRLERSRQVLESIMEALDVKHPLYETISKALLDLQDKELSAKLLEEGNDDQAIYDPSEDPSGKMSLRRKIIDMRNRLNSLMKDQKFAASYDGKRTRNKLDAVMDNMLRKVGKDQMVDPGEFSKLNTDVRGVLEDPDNLLKQLTPDQHNEIVRVVDQSTGSMRDAALDLRQQLAAAPQQQSNPDAGMIRQQILDRSEWRPEASSNMRVDRLIVGNSPSISPDTISIVAPTYTLKWDVSNVLGAKDAALEISKANKKFSNPRGATVDKENTLYYNPSMGAVTGQRKGSALELEGVGNYQYRVAAIDNRGEMISRFSDPTELVIVPNNVKVFANSPLVTPDTIYTEKPNYTFKWDVSNIDGASDAAVEVSNPNVSFANPNGRERDRVNTYFFNPSLGKINGTFGSNIDGLSGPGRYLFRVIAISPVGDFVGQWSDPDTLFVTTREALAQAEDEKKAAQLADSPKVVFQDTTLTVSWDVSKVDRAHSISLEITREDTSAARGDSTLLSRLFKGKTGSFSLGPGSLEGRGRYNFRVAAADSTGSLLTLWSKPTTWDYKGRAATGMDSSATTTMAQMKAAVAKSGADAPPEGKSLEVITDGTPLYSDKTVSGQELMNLKKGELLVLVTIDGMWDKVYYPAGRAYGWVLNFNIKSAGVN